MGIDESAVTAWRRGARHPGSVELSACRLLRRLAAAVPAGQAVVELGAYKGRATGWLLLGAQDGQGAHVTSVDPWTLQGPRPDYPLGENYSRPEVHRIFKDRMAAIGATADVHTAVRGFAAAVGQAWAGPPVGLLWHDAEHSAEAVQRDLEAWLPHLAPDATVVLHDAGDPRHGVVEGARRVLGVGYAGGWAYQGGDGWAYAEPQVIPWARRPQRRGVLVARRRPARLPDGPQQAVNTTDQAEPVLTADQAEPPGDDT